MVHGKKSPNAIASPDENWIPLPSQPYSYKQNSGSTGPTAPVPAAIKAIPGCHGTSSSKFFNLTSVMSCHDFLELNRVGSELTLNTRWIADFCQQDFESGPRTASPGSV
jgi:hypothetical protein